MVRRRWLAGLLGGLLMTAAQAQPPVLGWVEEAVLLPERVEVKVKMDTGALTSSLDARDIEAFKRDGRHWVRFTLSLKDSRTGALTVNRFERPVLRRVKLRGAGGVDHRPVVRMALCVGHWSREEEFTLRDRGDMLYPVLLGRRTLEHLGLVDVSRTFLNPPDCRAGASGPAAE